MGRANRYLFRMILFVGAVIATAAVLAPGLADAFASNPALNGVIFALILFGIAFSFRSVMMMTPDMRWMEVYQAKLDHRSQETLPDPRLLAPVARVLGEATSDGKPTLSALAMRALLDGIAARLSESREISRYLTGLLIFLGLLGTFWGLLQTIGSVNVVIDSLNVGAGDLASIFTDLKQGLQAPLSGMGTAFSSSLFGLAGSLTLGFLDLQAGQAQNRFYNEVEDWLSANTRMTGSTGVATDFGGEVGAAEYRLPAYVQSVVGQTAENLMAMERGLREAEGGRRRTEEVLTGMAEKMAALDDHLRDLSQILRRMADQQEKSGPALTRLADSAAEGLALDEATRSHIRSIDVLLKRLSTEVAEGRAQSVSEVRAEIRVLARTLADLATAEPH